jgi:hypothetical protein
MDLFKKPFSKQRENEQLTPDLLSQQKEPKPDKVKESAKEKQVEKTPQPQETPQLETQPAETDLPQPQAAPAQTAPAKSKSVTFKQVENILQEDLEDIYFNMDEAHRRMFKQEGERAIAQIEKIIASGKSVAVKVLEVIKQWLSLIPGVNKFFIEQEAKIKTDKIIKLNQSN